MQSMHSFVTQTGLGWRFVQHACAACCKLLIDFPVRPGCPELNAPRTLGL